VNTVLKQALLGRDSRDQAGIDARMIELDGTDTKAGWARITARDFTRECARRRRGRS